MWVNYVSVKGTGTVGNLDLKNFEASCGDIIKIQNCNNPQ